MTDFDLERADEYAQNIVASPSGTYPVAARHVAQQYLNLRGIAPIPKENIMPGRQNRCSGSGKAPSETYTRPVRGSGGVVREQRRGTCSDNPAHQDQPIHGGNVQGHSG